MYLVGILDNDLNFSVAMKRLGFKTSIEKSDLVKCKTDYGYQVIDISKKAFYDSESNTWKKMEWI